MQCPICSSPNVESLSHYWQSLPAESPLRGKYAPPDEVPSQAWIALIAVVGGIAVAVSGAILFGLLVAVGGLLFGAFNHAMVERYRGALADWTAARICLACPGLF
ncbi:hypothetical protein [Streptomyces canus]|uniref:hypothetical protein n=1 Tax=Streptomyces canus TaxID=58343 RepID=UPI00324437C6